MTTRTAKLLFLLVVLSALTATVDASAASAPKNLHPFLLRADETREREFSRTPAFAWNPVRGAVRYEFQLATSKAFSESGVVYSDTSLTTPVAAPSLTLPWISGSPHALYDHALATYGVVIAGVLAYAAWLARARRRLERELAARLFPNRG